jgi:hypothetical protein
VDALVEVLLHISVTLAAVACIFVLTTWCLSDAKVVASAHTIVQTKPYQTAERVDHRVTGYDRAAYLVYSKTDTDGQIYYLLSPIPTAYDGHELQWAQDHQATYVVEYQNGALAELARADGQPLPEGPEFIKLRIFLEDIGKKL